MTRSTPHSSIPSKSKTSALPLFTKLGPTIMKMGQFTDQAIAKLTHPKNKSHHSSFSFFSPIEHWVAYSDGWHNLTTDLLFWNGFFYLAFARTPWHLGSNKSRILLLRSQDAQTDWERVAEFSCPTHTQDLRDPKLCVIQNKLFLYFLTNQNYIPEPNQTHFSFSTNGTDWSKPENVSHPGWLFWRPKTNNHLDFFVPAYWHEHGRAHLFHSQDGKNWNPLVSLHEGDRNDETDLEILPNGSAWMISRLEISPSLFGHKDACSLIGKSDPPYTTWQKWYSHQNRIDGPNLFHYDGILFVVGRHHVGPNRILNRPGGIFGKKRTALFTVSSTDLIHLFDLPSCGDTSYPGVVIREDSLYISYYSNRIDQDYPCLLGMFLPTEIRIAKFPLSKIKKAAIDSLSISR